MMKYIFSLKNYSPHHPFYILMFLPEVQRGQGKCLKSCNNDIQLWSKFLFKGLSLGLIMIQMASKNELPVISLAKIYWQEFLKDLRQIYLIMNLKKVICDTFLLYCSILCFFLLAPKTPGRYFFLLFLIFARTFF